MESLRVLVHATEQDAALLVTALQGGRRTVAPLVVGTPQELLDALRSMRWGAVVCAHRTGLVDVAATLASVAAEAAGTPTLVVADDTEEASFAPWIRAGAADCVSYARLDRLVRAIEGAQEGPAVTVVQPLPTAIPGPGTGELAVLDTLPNLAWRTGGTGKCIFFNRAWLEFTGKPLDSQLGDGWFAGVHPEDRDRCITLHWKAFARRQGYEAEYRLRHRDGSYRWVVDLGRPVEENGEHVGFLGSCFDVTERRRAVEAMRESVAAVKTLLNATYDASLLLDADGTVLAANETAGTRLHAGADGLVGANIAELLPHEVRDLRLLQISGVLQSGRPTRFEDEASGVWYENTVYPMRDPKGAVTGAALFEREITAYKRVEQALRDSERSYRQLFETSGHASLIVDPETDSILEASAWASDLFGIGRDELLGSTWAALTGELGLTLAQQLSMLPPDSGHAIETTHVQRDGSSQILRFRTFLVEFTGRHAVMCVGTERDDAAALSARERHERSFRALENLAGEIGQGYDQLMEEMLGMVRASGSQTPGKDSGQRRRGLEEGLLRGRALAHRLLLCARREPGMPERLAVDDLLAETAQTAAHFLPANVTVTLAEIDPDIAVSADHEQILQALTALVAHAAAAMPEGGRVLLTGVVTELDDVEISVSDQGPGVDPELRSRFFEPFAVAGSDCWGAGLGLAMARGVVVGHGGSVDVTDRAGGGCTVRLRLPRTLGERSGVRRWADLS